MAFDFNPEHSTISSLETLVVQQLAEMLREEQKLQERYRRLNPAVSCESEMDSFSKELSRFNDRATRLYRMMEAMDGYSSPKSLRSESTFALA